MLSDNIRTHPVDWRPGVCFYIPKDLPNSHKDIRSYTEVGNKWLLMEPKISQYNLDSDLQHSNLSTSLEF